jgi:hypothetical protein
MRNSNTDFCELNLRDIGLLGLTFYASTLALQGGFERGIDIICASCQQPKLMVGHSRSKNC